MSDINSITSNRKGGLPISYRLRNPSNSPFRKGGLCNLPTLLKGNSSSPPLEKGGWGDFRLQRGNYSGEMFFAIIFVT